MRPGFCAQHRTLFHELRKPRPIPLTINQRRDWPLTDLETAPLAQSSTPLAMNSEELARYAAECARRRVRYVDRGADAQSTALVVGPAAADLVPFGASAAAALGWEAIAARFAELGPEMHPELASRLLRRLARAGFAEATALRAIARGLPFERFPPRELAQCATALVALRGKLGDEALGTFERLARCTVALGTKAWGAGAAPMLAALVRFGDGALARGEAGIALVGAISRAVPRMGVVQLEISAYACARAAHGAPRAEGLDAALAKSADALLKYGAVRINRFPPRGLLNFFVAAERLGGAEAVRPLAVLVEARLCTLSLVGCSAVDRYRAALCLLRAGCAVARTLVLLLGDPGTVEALGEPARRSMARRLRAAAQRRPDPEWTALATTLSPPTRRAPPVDAAPAALPAVD
eukprot:NODE_7266_length_1594_cov_9.381050.p1 GENE.NODE_7266_length_1594_cov_9.381050~~NODE_7266_length_1594_cov_9.381050.p1  ORF type:complete len:471 (+),score=103.94 NODE_7266_length_1594_cov_9.381050:186-1415(+)